MKFVISVKDKAKQVEVEDASALMGMKIGDKLSGDLIGLEGYEFEIRGGSDDSGFPMRRDLPGILRKKILTVKGTGVNNKVKGLRVRKSVAGNTITDSTAQINLIVVKEGTQSLFEEPKEEASEEAAEGSEEKTEEKSE